jgi:hypothetical protein
MLLINVKILVMKPAKDKSVHYYFLANCVGFEPFDKVGPVNLTN